jgi:spore maturation protein CgeB
MSLEGNDVASNLKWVMSSNCIAVSPRHTCETWFMEGTLKPNYHYIECKPDFSDLEERLQYYIDHPEEAEAIIQHAHEYIDQFRDLEREHLISLLVLKKYFEITNGRYK